MKKDYWKTGEFIFAGYIGGTLGIYLYGKTGLFLGILMGIIGGFIKASLSK